MIWPTNPPIHPPTHQKKTTHPMGGGILHKFQIF